MKRVTSFLAAIILMLCSVAASAETTRTGMNLSHQRIVWMAQYMRELVYGDYLEIKQAPETVQSIARNWAVGIDETPKLVVELDVNNFSAMVQLRAIFRQEPPMVAYEAESTTIVSIWQAMAYSAAQENALAESSYEEIMGINGTVNAFQMYAEDGEEGNAMYLVIYENAAPILLLVNAENGAVSIQGVFLPSAKLADCANYGQVSLWMMRNGLSITCQEIKAE